MKVTEVGERVVRRETDFLNLLPPVGAISPSIRSKKEEGRRKGGGWGEEGRFVERSRGVLS